MGLHRVCPVVRFLGSYPRADGAPNEVRTGHERRATSRRPGAGSTSCGQPVA